MNEDHKNDSQPSAEKQDPSRGTPFMPPTQGESSPIEKFKEKILQDYDRLGLDDEFSFACHDKVPCFNACCADVNIFLTPYDVLRMKNAIDMDSSEFLDKYTQLPIEKNQKYPVVMFRMDHEKEGLPCQFVDTGGCTIYEDRPWPCRMYPLGMASPKDDEVGEEFYFLMKEDVCQGFEEAKKWSVREWLSDQGMETYDEFGRYFKEITLHDFFGKNQTLPPEKMEMFYTACYDLDSFRRFIFESTFLKRFDIEAETVAAIKDDDEALLRFAFRWLRFALFGEETIGIRPEALGPKSTPKG